MSITKARELVVRHHKYAWVLTLVAIFAVSGVYFKKEFVSAATYYFTQASWTGGLDAVSTASHASNQSGWVKYSATTTGITATSSIGLAVTSYTVTDDGTLTTTGSATGGTFGAGTNSNTAVSGTGSGASVGLGIDVGTGSDGALDLSSSAGTGCSGTGLSWASPVCTLTSNASKSVWNFSSINIASGYTLRGSTSGTVFVTLKSQGAVTIGGVVDLNASGAAAGPGGYNGVAGVNTPGAGPGAGGGGVGGCGYSGGGGAGYGAAGGAGEDVCAAGGVGGSVYTTESGGSSGGSGRGPGGSGAGGGYLKIISASINNTGTITANGGDGAAWMAGGGGAGGRINLISYDIANTGIIRVNGGSGSYGDGPGGDGFGGGGGGAGGRIILQDSDGAISGGTITATGGAAGDAGSFNGGTPSPAYTQGTLTYISSATFTSAAINLGAPSIFSTISWNATLNSQTITIKARSSANADMSGATAWGSCTNVTSGGNLSSGGCVTDGHQYIQYQATLSTANTSVTPTLNDVTIGYSQYAASASLTSSAYNSVSGNVMGGIRWDENETPPAGTTVTVSLRTSNTSGGLAGASWTDFTNATTNCSKSVRTVTCTAAAIPSGMKDGLNDEWFQYKVTMTSTGGYTQDVDNVVVVYVVNAPPAFDATYGTNGISVSQVSDLGSADLGKVSISYSIKDIDTTTGTTPGTVLPSFEYYNGSTWAAISSGDLSAGATGSKSVAENSYTTHTAIWTASSTASLAIASAKVRITLNDSEAVNNLAVAESAAFTLDTIAPTVGNGHFTLNSSTGGSTAGTLTLTATDYGNLQYRFCNDSTFPSTDTQGNSCAWTTLASGPIASTTASWVTTGYPNSETVYGQIRDLYGNVTTGTAIALAQPTNFDYKDISNVNIDVYREFLSWGASESTPGATFGSYKLYHATTSDVLTLPSSGDFSLLTTISDSATNYYTHTITTATSSAHHYKVVAVTANGDISNETAVLSDVPNGTGGQTEQAPVITDTPTADLIKNTSARISFTTDILATSTVEYGTSLSYGSSVPEASYTKNHGVYLNSLTPNTQYYFRAKAGSVGGQESDWKTGSTYFTTASGPIITGVTPMNITDKTATIFWNTHASSTSKVYYASSRALLTAGGTLVTGSDSDTAGTNGLYQHQVGIPSAGVSFTPGVTYYFYVSSTSKDGQNITTTDNNNGQYYSFTTTLDTSAPTISNISAAVIAPTSAVIVWSTDEPATSQVKYSATSGSYGKQTNTDMSFANIPSYTVYHVATLSAQTSNVGEGGGTNALAAETPYYYKVVSADAAGNSTESDGQTFTTTKVGETLVVTRRITSEADAGPVPDTTAPVISNIKVVSITPFSAKVTFDTSEGAVGKVSYGKDLSYGDNAADDFSWGTAHTVSLRGLTLGTEYHIKISAADKAGNIGSSDDQTFKTLFLSENIKELTNVENIEQFQKEIEEAIESILPSLVPPFVSKPTVTDITENSAMVSFRTNIKSFPLVGFVEDTTYSISAENPYTSEVSDTTEKRTNHTLNLLNLKPNTKYHIQARAFSLPQVVGKSDDVTFTTKASKIHASIVETKRDSFTVVWITDEPTSSTVEYKNLATGIAERKTDNKLTSSHSMRIENLPSAASYEVIISGLNAGGNLIEGGSPLRVTTSKDVTAPILSNFKVSNAMVPGRTDRIQTIISWATDEPADSIVYYEEGIGTPGDEKELANKSEASDSTTNHNIIISSFKPGAIYRIKVTSTDDSGNIGIFGPRTIITPKQTESISDIIFKNFEDSFKFLRNF